MLMELNLQNASFCLKMSVSGAGCPWSAGSRQGLSVETQTVASGTSICHVSCQTMDCLADVEAELSDLRKVMLALDTEKVPYEALTMITSFLSANWEKLRHFLQTRGG